MSYEKCAACKGDYMEYMGHLKRFSLYGCTNCGHMFADYGTDNYDSWDDDDGY